MTGEDGEGAGQMAEQAEVVWDVVVVGGDALGIPVTTGDITGLEIVEDRLTGVRLDDDRAAAGGQTAEEHQRPVPVPGGQTVTLHDVVVRATRRP